MTDRTGLSEFIRNGLRCPVCRSRLQEHSERLSCVNESCAKAFPIVDGVPVLINEEASIFEIARYSGPAAVTTFRPQSGLEKFLARALPEITANFVSVENYAKLREILSGISPCPRILVVGCGEVGRGMDKLAADTELEFINTDVAMGGSVHIICDSHDLPFADRVFDAVIVQAVLEHVADPTRCVDEIYRVLAEKGVVYAETPFMQQVHGGPFDFTRFTDLGHRRLFRRFEEISSGATAGSALALAWSFQYFLLSLVNTMLMRSAMKAIARISLFWLKYVDRALLRRPGTYDAALGFFFLGRKSDKTLSDRELVKRYRGGGTLLPSQD